MQQLCAVRSVSPAGQGAMGWFRHVVRPLRMAQEAVLACIARQHLERPYAGRCFAGHEGGGCELSRDELAVAARVAGEPMSWEV